MRRPAKIHRHKRCKGCVKTFLENRWPQDEIPDPEITASTWAQVTQWHNTQGGVKPNTIYDYEDSVSNSDPSTYVHAMMVGGFKNGQFVSGYVGFAESRDTENQYMDYFCKFEDVPKGTCNAGESTSNYPCYDKLCTTTQRNDENVIKSFKFRFTPVAAVCAPCGVGFYKIAGQRGLRRVPRRDDHQRDGEQQLERLPLQRGLHRAGRGRVRAVRGGQVQGKCRSRLARVHVLPRQLTQPGRGGHSGDGLPVQRGLYRTGRGRVLRVCCWQVQDSDGQRGVQLVSGKLALARGK